MPSTGVPDETARLLSLVNRLNRVILALSVSVQTEYTAASYTWETYTTLQQLNDGFERTLRDLGHDTIEED